MLPCISCNLFLNQGQRRMPLCWIYRKSKLKSRWTFSTGYFTLEYGCNYIFTLLTASFLSLRGTLVGGLTSLCPLCPSVGRLVCWSVRPLACLSKFLKGRRLHFHTPFEHFIYILNYRLNRRYIHFINFMWRQWRPILKPVFCTSCCVCVRGGGGLHPDRGGRIHHSTNYR